MATTETPKRTIATDIAAISTALDGVTNFESIKFSQILICEHGENVNDLMFVRKIRGIYFYTSRCAFESRICHLTKAATPTYVVCAESKNVYEIK